MLYPHWYAETSAHNTSQVEGYAQNWLTRAFNANLQVHGFDIV